MRLQEDNEEDNNDDEVISEDVDRKSVEDTDVVEEENTIGDKKEEKNLSL